MTVSAKIKALLKIREKSNGELAEHLGISDQGIRQKLYTDTFSISDLIRICAFLGYELSIADEQQKLILNESDIKK